MGGKLRFLGGALAVIMMCAGCMEVNSEILVKKDGSGTITETAYMTAEGSAMMKGMADQMGAKSQGQGPKLLDKEKLQKKADAMGAKLVSAEEVKAEDGREGYKAVFSFDDISKLKMFMGDTPQPAKDGKEQNFTFEFTKGAPAKLVMKSPPFDPEKGPIGGDMPPDDAQAKQQIMMMKSMVKGMTAWMRLTVEGKITETNATHVNKDKTGITIMKMDFDKMTADVDKFIAMSRIKDEAKAKEAVVDMPGLDIETNDTVTIVFE